MAKKQKTLKQIKNRKKLGVKLCYGGEFLATATPYAIMAGVNADTWFVQNPDSWKVGLGGALGIALLGFALFLVNANREKKEGNSNNKMLGLVIMWYAIAFVFFCLAQINMEIYKIMCYGGLGLITALGINIEARHLNNEIDDIEQGMHKAKLDNITERAKEENQGKIKF